ncbi:MAG TPA: hypothetical protein VK181_22310 [Rhizobium sp.]|nr:hypothetical protein [Rhizobium sp.]
MTVFSTEFSVRDSVTREMFAAQAIAWVSGMTDTTLFGSGIDKNDLGDETTIVSRSGERFTLKECSLCDGFAIGARHEIPDDFGRAWRSEVTLISRPARAALRVKTQCIIASDGAKPQTPKKPYFVKLAIQDAWPTTDGEFDLSQEPFQLSETDVELASRVINGSVSALLPIVYVSKMDGNRTALGEDEVERLAFRLGGIAHVLVEPSRDFSRRLMQAAGARNPYGGSIGICVSGFGVVRRYFLGPMFPHPDELSQAIYGFAAQYVTNRKPRLGWDWQDLLEESTRQLRSQVDAGSADFEAWITNVGEEIEEKDNEIKVLREQLERLQREGLESAKNDSISIFRQVF